jgi:hypothetical protein
METRFLLRIEAQLAGKEKVVKKLNEKEEYEGD